MLTTTAVVFAALISSATGRWAKICATQSANKIRGCDSYGCGAYNDQSGGKPHKGVDVICRDGSLVYSPFTGSTKMQAKPFGNRNAIDNGVLLHGSGFCLKIFYIKPFKYRGSIRKGERLCVLLPMQKVHPGIISHIHIQNCDLSDPTPNI
uniref:Leukocyte cell derived chemotaxin 2 n=1 Tax=Sphenodon punctatus TaxID=8508 RepID=A0A8D0GWV3_SPHPU